MPPTSMNIQYKDICGCHKPQGQPTNQSAGPFFKGNYYGMFLRRHITPRADEDIVEPGFPVCCAKCMCTPEEVSIEPQNARQ